MRSLVPDVKNGVLLKTIFGCWPSFHDAEVLSFDHVEDDGQGGRLEMKLHHWRMTNEVDARGSFILTHHTLTTLCFSGLTEMRSGGSLAPNIITELDITRLPAGGFAVEISSVSNDFANFNCREIEVLSAIPEQTKGD